MDSFQFIFPKIKSRHVLAKPWRFCLVRDHVNSSFCTYFLSDGLGMGVYDNSNSSVVLPEDTVLEISYFDSSKIMFNLIGVAGENINIGAFGSITFWVYIGEMEKLHLKS